jgi:hypothetical protein
MLRSITAVLVGVVLGAIFVFIAQFLGHQLFPAPAGFDATNPDALKALPFATKFSVLVSWFAGAFGGGVLASFISRRWAPAVWVVALTILLFAATNFSAFPHPLWMMVGSIPATALGGFFAIRVTGARYGRPAAPANPTPGL